MKTKIISILLFGALTLNLSIAFAEAPPAVDSPFDSSNEAPPSLNFGSISDDEEDDTPPVLSGSGSVNTTTPDPVNNVTPPAPKPTPTPVSTPPTQPKPVVTATPKKVTNSGPETAVFLSLALIGGYAYRKLRA